MKSFLTLASAAVLASAALSACNTGGQTQNPSMPLLSVSSSALTIDDQGGVATIRVSAFNADNTAGSGTVELAAAAGEFENGDKSITLTLDQGKGSTTFSCAKATDAFCSGAVRIEGTWNGLTRVTTLQVRDPNQSSGNTPDGGQGTPDGGSGGDGGTQVVAGPPANILFLSDGVNEQLGLRASGRETSTPVYFQVVDLNGVGVPNVEVSFSVAGAGGATVSPLKATTDRQGNVSTSLQSGDEVGVAIVSATIATPALRGTARGIPVVGAWPSDEGFQVVCVDINLAASASVTPPRWDLSTNCQAKLVDRFENPVTLPTAVTWYSEAGSVKSPVLSDGNGLAVTDFSTFGKYPPAETTPDVGEPVSSDGWRNPRDMLVTLIAVTSGEEEFYDGSGVSNGQKDGKWNPGEWFVDVPEPFVDENDNQQYDPGESFVDTERLNCATGVVEPKNGRWDGPNGCWDANVQLWRPAHILYSGAVAEFEVMNVPTPPATVWTLPAQIDAGTSVDIDVRFSDAYLNAIAPDGADVSPVYKGKRGGAELAGMRNGLTERFYGFAITYERLYRTPGGTTEPCAPTAAAPAQAEASPELASCMRQYRLSDFQAGNTAVITLSGADEASADGPTSASLSVKVVNAYFSPVIWPVGSTTIE